MNKRTNSNQIDWDNINATTVSPFEMNKLLDEYGIDTLIPEKNNGIPLQRLITKYNQKNVFVRVLNNCYMFQLIRKEPVKIEYKPGKFITSCELKPYVYRVAPNNENPTLNDVNALKIFMQFQKLFKEQYQRTFSSVFTKSNDINFKRCIPKPINVGYPSFEPFFHVYKADVSSAYGYELSKTLPTAKDMLIIDGFEKPTKEYPFAYYLKEKQVSIYGEFESNINVAEKTYLMKASPLSLKPIIDKIYESKEAAQTEEERLLYKSMLNIPIGYFQKRDNPVYAYITAVVIARCNHRMETLATKITNAGNRVILINTDAIGWEGEDMPEIYTEEKGLGNFIVENRNAKACVMGPKCYQILQDGNLKTIYAGLPKRFSEKMGFGEILTVNRDLEAAVWNPNKVRFEFESINKFYHTRGK